VRPAGRTVARPDTAATRGGLFERLAAWWAAAMDPDVRNLDGIDASRRPGSPWDEIPVRDSLADRAAAPVRGTWRIVVGGYGDGSGRTTVATALGMALAASRWDPVAALDPHPDRSGALARRVDVRMRHDVRDLVRARARLQGLTDVRRFAAADPSTGLEVLRGLSNLGGADQLDAVQVAAAEFGEALAEIKRWYPISIVDCAPGWHEPVSASALPGADVCVLVTPATPEDIAAADEALTALGQAGHGDLVASTVAALVSPRRGRWSPQTRLAASRLAPRVGSVVRIPYDPRLAAGAPIDYPRLRRRTRTAFLRLAVAVVEHCATPGWVPTRPVPVGTR
jgi:MinD-like ATPase involved in chromosome partitioning or flagellar assembly